MIEKILTALLLACFLNSIGIQKLNADDLHPSPLILRGHLFDNSFNVEFAIDAEKRRKGLMFRKQMDPDSAMLFLFEKNHQPFMWMKNTYISLDMLFINEAGNVVYIVENTTPLSETPIHPPADLEACAVLEVKAGSVKHKGIQVGDHVIHPLLSPNNHSR